MTTPLRKQVEDKIELILKSTIKRKILDSDESMLVLDDSVTAIANLIESYAKRAEDAERDAKRWKIGYEGFKGWLQKICEPFYTWSEKNQGIRFDHEGDLQELLESHLKFITQRLESAEKELARLRERKDEA